MLHYRVRVSDVQRPISAAPAFVAHKDLARDGYSQGVRSDVRDRRPVSTIRAGDVQLAVSDHAILLPAGYLRAEHWSDDNLYCLY